MPVARCYINFDRICLMAKPNTEQMMDGRPDYAVGYIGWATCCSAAGGGGDGASFPLGTSDQTKAGYASYRDQHVLPSSFLNLIRAETREAHGRPTSTRVDVFVLKRKILLTSARRWWWWCLLLRLLLLLFVRHDAGSCMAYRLYPSCPARWGA